MSSSTSKASPLTVARTSAFTIEVLMVIAILGIMAATAAYSMNSVFQHAAKTARFSQQSPLACPTSNTAAPATQVPGSSGC